jgi:hypothetical protein
MAGTLRHLAANCAGDARPDCPILEDLARLPQPAGREAREGLSRRGRAR